MKVALLTEGFQGTGYGHLTRCLSICQAFEEQGIQPLYIANCDDEGRSFIKKNVIVMDWLRRGNHLLDLICGYDTAIIDSYLAPVEMYADIGKTVERLAFVDDFARIRYPKGTIINGSIGAEDIPYREDVGYQLLLGIDYVPLRKEFWDVVFAAHQREDRVCDVLIAFGGQDLRNLTFSVLDDLLSSFPDLRFHVVLPPNKGGRQLLYEKKVNVHFYHTLGAGEMLQLMLHCNVAVSAAGQTTYELARLGIPTVAVGVAENQKYNVKGWLAAGFIQREIWFDMDEFMSNIKYELLDIIRHYECRQRRYCDGQGARRIVAAILDKRLQ